MLSILLSKEIKSEDKKKILSEEFNIPMTKELKGSVKNMCNLSQGIYDDAIIYSIKNLMINLNLNIEQCMDALNIHDDRRETYKEIILNESVIV